MPSIKLKEIFSKNDENKLVLPDFQRDFVWDKEQQKNLLASFMTYLPVGSVLLLEGDKDDFANKKMCFPKESCVPKEECIYLLDGQQRITSLKSIFTDLFDDLDNWKNIWQSIFKDLRNRWFIRVIPKDGEDDIFGYKLLKFNDLKKYEPNEVVNFVEYKQVFKTKTQEWVNPGFIVKDKEGNIIENKDINMRNYYISEFAAKEGLIPLFTLFKNGNAKALHEYVVERIARDRVWEIKSKIDDLNDSEEKRKKINEYLIDIEPNIDILIRNGDENSINSAWSNLSAKWSRDILNYLEGILDEEISTIELDSNEINRAVAIFENINKGGTPLNTYDLVVAKAAKNKNLESLSKRILRYLQQEVIISDAVRDNLICDIEKWYPKYIKLINDNELTKIIKSQFLNMLSIFTYSSEGGVDNIKVEHIKRTKILKLTSEEINHNTEKAVTALIRATAFLQLKCGIVDIKELPYELMILPIAYCLMDDNVWNDKYSIRKIENWYWTCLFSGAYRERQNEQCIKDIKNLFKWINEEITNPYEIYYSKVLAEPGYSNLEILLMKDETHELQMAMKKAILQYILSQEPKDFIYDGLYLSAWKIGAEESYRFDGTNQAVKVEDHHIYPLSDATKIGQSSKNIRSEKKHILNSPLNRTYISANSNSKISDMQPNDYFNYVSRVAQYGHCISTPINDYFNRNSDEDDVQFYERILRCRYNKIHEILLNELDRLKL